MKRRLRNSLQTLTGSFITFIRAENMLYLKKWISYETTFCSRVPEFSNLLLRDAAQWEGYTNVSLIFNGVYSYNFDDFLGVRWGTAQNTYHVVTSSIFSVIIMLFMHQLLITAPYFPLLIWCHARIKQFHSVVTQIYNCKGETECYGTAICQQFTGNQTLRHWPMTNGHEYCANTLHFLLYLNILWAQTWLICTQEYEIHILDWKHNFDL